MAVVLGVLALAGVAIVALALIGVAAEEDRAGVEADGVSWTMSEDPRRNTYQVPGGDGSSISTQVFLATGDAHTEGVYLYDATGRTFDADAGLDGMAMEIGGTAADKADGTLAGEPARTATIELTVQGEPRTGYAIVSRHGDVVIAAAVFDLRGESTQQELKDQFDQLVDSIEVG